MQTAFLDSVGSKQVPSTTAKRDDPRAVVLDTLEVLDSKKPRAIVGSAKNKIIGAIGRLLPATVYANMVVHMVSNW